MYAEPSLERCGPGNLLLKQIFSLGRPHLLFDFHNEMGDKQHDFIIVVQTGTIVRVKILLLVIIQEARPKTVPNKMRCMVILVINHQGD